MRCTIPEGPEVKKFGESLASVISMQDLIDVKILSGRYQKNGLDKLEEFKANLPVKVVGPGVHGKFLYWILDNNWTLWNTLGMTGSWSPEKRKHSRIEFVFSDRSVFFNDQRNFGTIKLVENRMFLVEKLKSLGPDMLSEDVDNQIFLEKIKGCKKKTITQALMDQSVIAGVGNYLKSESLYLSGISPHRTCDTLSDEELEKLNTCIKKVIRDAYASGGATIQSYSDFNNEIGEYSQKFSVYNQKKDPEGNTVIKEKTKDGRSTFWVLEKQQ